MRMMFASRIPLPRFTRGIAAAALAFFAASPLQLRGSAQEQHAHATPMSSTAIRPPVAATKPHEIKSPYGNRTDPYYWLRDDTRKSPEMLGHLRAEQAHTEAMLEPTRELQANLFKEITARLKPDDVSAPVKEGAYLYYTRFEKGREYPIYARKLVSSADEHVLLDGNALAKGHDFFHIGGTAISPDARQLAYAVDTVSRRQYTLRVKDVTTGQMHPDTITNAEPVIVWAADNRTFFYVEKDPITLLPFRVRRHVLGADVAKDPFVYQEPDNAFYLTVYRSRSARYVFIYSQSTLSAEARYVPTDRPDAPPTLVLTREPVHEYQVDHGADDFVIRTNWQARNFRIVRAPVATSTDKATWRDVVPHRTDAFVEGFDVFTRYLAVGERSGGLRKVRIRSWDGKQDSLIAEDAPTYTSSLGENRELETDVLRYSYESLAMPETFYDYNMRTGERIVVKREAVVGDFDPANYTAEYVHAPARDGARIPISLFYRKGTRKDGSAPLYVYGYGSYGASSDPTFSSQRLSLVDRGFIFAIAHIRGGQELGRDWYESGKLLKKKNTFTDFVDATDYLVREGYGAKDKVVAMGGSAGGLLMGAVANMAPERYRVMVAHVPFVDVVTTMLDTSIPLTTNEFDEWGNPAATKSTYDYVLSYSPYDNVKAQAYPAMLVTAGLWDSQVQYFEPAKWVAKLRAAKTDRNPLLLHINMEAGHSGKSGRYKRYEDTAREYAFILGQLGILR
jgi:oligopeptidase B